MSKYIQRLMSPQLMMAIYLFVGFIAALYILSVVYVFIDAKRRGVNAFWAWGIVSLIPFVGLIAYLVLRPNSYIADREEQELDMALRERQLAQYGTCPQVRQPHREGLCGVPRVQHPGAQRLPQLPSFPRCPLEGMPLLPNSHSIAHAPLAGCISAPVFARRSNTERRALV